VDASRKLFHIRLGNFERKVDPPNEIINGRTLVLWSGLLVAVGLVYLDYQIYHNEQP